LSGGATLGEVHAPGAGHDLAGLTQLLGRPVVLRLLGSLRRDVAEFLAAPGVAAPLARQAHALRGACDALGLGALAAACRDVEATERAGGAPPDPAGALIAAAAHALSEIDREIAAP
jgi:HPt (histidine-containing phosphotransfer) domain-containing protein